MTIQSSQSVTVLFTTRVFATGVGTNADSLPTGTLYKNGIANAATVTITNISTGLYKAQVTLPTLAIGDEVEIAIAATVSTISDTAIIWGDTNDLAVDGSGEVTFNNTSIATTTNLTNAPTAGDFTSTMKTSLNAATPASVTGAVGSVTGAVGSVTGAVGSVTSGVTVTTNSDKTGYTLTNAGYAAVMTQQLTESYAAKGTVPTPAQLLLEVRALLAENNVASTTVTTKKIDGSTSAHTYTLNSSTAPTTITTAS